MSTESICPQCGAAQPAQSPEGLCPQCLLLAGLTSEPAATTPSPGQGAYAPRSPGHGGFVPPELDEIARAFPQLEVLELIGRGGMGAVYKARQRELDRLVALKILPPDIGSDPAFAQRFNREARALAKLNHPHIVTIFDSGQSGGLYYLLMEFVDGVNLRQTIRAGELKSTEALAIVPQICDALQYAHDEGIVHRDIKPENILVDKRGRVKIADFGLAKLLASGGRESPENVSLLTATAQVMGTLHYMAPEQMESSAHVDHRADIYSLGVVFYELLTGEVPMGRFDPPSKRVEVDVRLDDIVLRTLEREPSRRYQRASEVKTDVQSIASSPATPRKLSNDGAAAIADLETARQDVMTPATVLFWVGIVCLLISVVPFCAIPLLAMSRIARWVHLLLVLGYGSLLVQLPVSVIMIIGGRRMQRLESHGLAVLASLLALLPCQPLFPLGWIAGVWSLIVLNRPHIKAAFAEQAKLRVARGSSGGDSTARGDSNAWLGRPLAQIRFIVDEACDVGPQAIFHFSALGYELIEQQPDVCIFQRGRTSGGLWSTDIRQLHTRPTVRTANAANGQRWVSCDWSVRTLGSWITRRDIETLEAEGRGLQAMAGDKRSARHPQQHAVTPTTVGRQQSIVEREQTGQTYHSQTYPRDTLDILFTFAALPMILGMFMVLPGGAALLVGLAAGLSIWQSAALAGIAGIGVFTVGFIVLGSGSVRSIAIDRDGLTVNRFIGPSKFLPWSSVRRIAPLTRTQALTQVWLWPGLPPRGSIVCMSVSGYQRIDCEGDCWYVCPRNVERFYGAIEHFRAPAGETAPVELPPPTTERDDVLHQLGGPALGMFALGFGYVLLGVVLLVVTSLIPGSWNTPATKPPFYGVVSLWGAIATFCGASIVLGIIAFDAGRRMLALRGWPVAVAATVVAAIPLGFIFQLPLGVMHFYPLISVWALVTLLLPKVRAQFFSRPSFGEAKQGLLSP